MRHHGEDRRHACEDQKRNMTDAAHADLLDDARVQEVGAGERTGNSGKPEREGLPLSEDFTENLLGGRNEGEQCAEDDARCAHVTECDA